MGNLYKLAIYARPGNSRETLPSLIFIQIAAYISVAVAKCASLSRKVLHNPNIGAARWPHVKRNS